MTQVKIFSTTAFFCKAADETSKKTITCQSGDWIQMDPQYFSEKNLYY